MFKGWWKRWTGMGGASAPEDQPEEIRAPSEQPTHPMEVTDAGRKVEVSGGVGQPIFDPVEDIIKPDFPTNRPELWPKSKVVPVPVPMGPVLAHELDPDDPTDPGTLSPGMIRLLHQNQQRVNPKRST